MSTVDVSVDPTHGLVVMTFDDGEVLLTWDAARVLAHALFTATESITDVADRELDEEMGKHAHVSARWLGEMGREQRSN